MAKNNSELRLTLRVEYAGEEGRLNQAIICTVRPDNWRNKRIAHRIIARAPKVTVTKCCLTALRDTGSLRHNDDISYGIKGGVPFAINKTRQYSILPQYILGINNQKV